MSFRHVVLLSLVEGTTSARRDAIIEALRGLPAVIPELRSYVVGADAGRAAGNFDIAVVADFDDPAGHAAYADHPEHQRILTELIRPVLRARAAVQHELT